MAISVPVNLARGYHGTMQRLVINAAIADGLDVIGDRWSLLILRDVFLGRRKFNALQHHTGAGRATLTRRLEQLIANDVLYRRPYSASRFEYNLTEKGRSLFGTSLLAWQWETEWAKDAGQSALPAALKHSLCGKPLSPVAICRHCQAAIKHTDIEWRHEASTLDEQFSAIKSANRQRRIKVNKLTGQDSALAHIADLVGDRWTVLILIASLFGVQQHDDYVRQLGIATNILAERLKMLTESNVLGKQPYQSHPLRYLYQLTEKGMSLLPFLMAVRQWAADWAEHEPASELTHACGHTLVVDVVCGGCQQKPKPADTGFA